jgi:hypothetical protein
MTRAVWIVTDARCGCEVPLSREIGLECFLFGVRRCHDRMAAVAPVIVPTRSSRRQGGVSRWVRPCWG